MFECYIQTMNILIVNQSVVDMCASFFTLLTAVVKVDGTRMSRDSSYDQFVCHIWLTRQPLFYFLVISTYGIILMALDRYIAVICPIWQNNNVRSACGGDFFIARQHTDAWYWYSRAVRLSVCLSVCPLRSGIRWKRLNIIVIVFSPCSSPIILVLPASNIFTKFRRGHPLWGR